MTRVQVLLTEEQDRRLEGLARTLRVSKARLVREGVDHVLRHRAIRRGDPLLALVGQAGRVGRRDIAGRHDAYLSRVQGKRRR